MIDTVLEAVTDTEIRLSLHRIRLTVFAETEAAIQYISKITDDHPDMYQLLEDTISLGGWVEPDIIWPR